MAPTIVTSKQFHHYSVELGWPVQFENGHCYLPTNAGMVGLVLPVALASEVSAEFTRRGMFVPTLKSPERQKRWIFLADTPTSVPPDIPGWTELISGPQRILLPGGPGLARWIREPTREHQRAPGYALAVSAIRSVLRRSAVGV
ncbi:hypothetical protein [Amycolatopsis sp. NPDC059657]|uniref:hypothetical protein n=1 Tax=Amycolatopsis sp. NPDC059657 TaxID=3346899 RepID=UPI00366B5878